MNRNYLPLTLPLWVKSKIKLKTKLIYYYTETSADRFGRMPEQGCIQFHKWIYTLDNV